MGEGFKKVNLWNNAIFEYPLFYVFCVMNSCAITPGQFARSRINSNAFYRLAYFNYRWIDELDIEGGRGCTNDTRERMKIVSHWLKLEKRLSDVCTGLS